MRWTLSVIVLAVLSTALTPSAARADWCASYGGAEMSGGGNCFKTFELCMQSVSGIGGFCSPARTAASDDKPAPKKTKKKAN